MAGKSLTMNQIKRILQEIINGESKRSIARKCNVSRNTVKGYLNIVSQSKHPPEEILNFSESELSKMFFCKASTTLSHNERVNDFKSRCPLFVSELTRTGVTRQILWEEYIQDVPGGYSYSQFCYHLSQYLSIKKTVMYFNHSAGEVMEVDFAGKLWEYEDEEGNLQRCPVFVAVLPFSGYTYVEVTESQSQECFMKCLENALIYFGGVPHGIISDNLKSAIKRSDRYEPQVTDLLEQFSLHYNTTVTATRVAKPRDKASVEKTVHLTYQRIYAPLRNNVFDCLEQINAAVKEQLINHHTRPFRSKDTTREKLFLEQEQQALRSLPASRFNIVKSVSAKVQKNYHVTLGEDWHFYSVPYQYVGKEVKINYTQDSVAIYLNHERIAFHGRNRRRYQYTTSKEHMPENHQQMQQINGYNVEYFTVRAKSISIPTCELVEKILSGRTFPQQAFSSCLGILRLEQKYGRERLTKASLIALAACQYNYKFVNNVLQNGMDKISDDNNSGQLNFGWHENVRGSQTYQ